MFVEIISNHLNLCVLSFDFFKIIYFVCVHKLLVKLLLFDPTIYVIEFEQLLGNKAFVEVNRTMLCLRVLFHVTSLIHTLDAHLSQILSVVLPGYHS